MKHEIHANSVTSPATTDYGERLLDVVYTVAERLECTISVDDIFCAASRISQYHARVEITFDPEGSDIGDREWDAVLRAIENELDRHPFFEDYNHDFF